jgi:hypothetical protein
MERTEFTEAIDATELTESTEKALFKDANAQIEVQAKIDI